MGMDLQPFLFVSLLKKSVHAW